MTTAPTIDTRSAQPYIATRAVMPMSELPARIPEMTRMVADWLKSNALTPAGKPFLRFHVIDMPKRMDIGIGFPVDDTADIVGGVDEDELPAGRYAIMKYTGVKNGIRANERLLNWIAEQGEAADSARSPSGEAFKARYETFLVDSEVQPDQDKLEFEVAIRLRD